jgi:hypothetical protein
MGNLGTKAVKTILAPGPAPPAFRIHDELGIRIYSKWGVGLRALGLRMKM